MGNIGQVGEEIAEEYLKKRGYKIIGKNFKTPRWGQIDLIGKDKDTLVFVEVKTRSAASTFLYGEPQDALNIFQKRALLRAAQFYLLREKYKGPARYDLVAIILGENEKPLSIELLKMADEEEFR